MAMLDNSEITRIPIFLDFWIFIYKSISSILIIVTRNLRIYVKTVFMKPSHDGVTASKYHIEKILNFHFFVEVQ